MKEEEKLRKIKDYFLSQGFIVRDGLNYSVDFLLYTDDVNKVHAKYAVLLNRNMSYVLVNGIQRICRSVKKALILVDIVNGRVEMVRVERCTLTE